MQMIASSKPAPKVHCQSSGALQAGTKSKSGRGEIQASPTGFAVSDQFHTLSARNAGSPAVTRNRNLEELIKLRRPDGMPLHWGHVVYLITLDRKKDRKRLQKQAAREGWSAPELHAAIQGRSGRRCGSGWPPDQSSPDNRRPVAIDDPRNGTLVEAL